MSGVVSAARATERRMKTARAQRKNIGGYHTCFAHLAKGFFPCFDRKTKTLLKRFNALRLSQ
jgi:hypothetical protein